jgi:hypothetical protein
MSSLEEQEQGLIELSNFFHNDLESLSQEYLASLHREFLSFFQEFHEDENEKSSFKELQNYALSLSKKELIKEVEQDMDVLLFWNR